MAMQIQACFLHLECRRLKRQNCGKAEEQLKETQNRLRQNQFDRLYYQYTEEQLVDEYNRLKKIYLAKTDQYRFFIP